MLELINLDCVRGGRPLFRNLNVSVPDGTLVQVEGANGSGKTSLLRIVCGLMSPESGEVRWNGTNIKSFAEEYAQTLAYLGHRNGIKEELTPLENLTVSNSVAGNKLKTEDARAALKLLGLEGRQNLPVRYLSEGQRRRAALARIITGAAKLWVLDEVLAALDTAAVGVVRTVIERHLENGGTAVVATHHDLQITAGSFQRLELAS
ncbi:MAG TPA: cytochrome c biogenesis heme-transporting ATPase CcmA [Pyrinomonadaceae bacterium]|nr:cytochrome c biogenesis heme-transporting ATPase CcmA [Pyrinomonadaceae bacterium]